MMPEQEQRARLLTLAELERIDKCLLSHASNRFQKVARIVGLSMKDLNHQFHLPAVFFSGRIKHLVESGALEAAGNLDRMRCSEVRIPGSLRSVQ